MVFFRSTNDGVEIGNRCGTIMDGNSAILCQQEGRRELVCNELSMNSNNFILLYVLLDKVLNKLKRMLK